MTTTVHRLEQARNLLLDVGWVVIPDDASFRVQVTKDHTGQYVSYFDPELKALVVVLHSVLKEALGIV